jgi:hypothetical protein
MLWFRHLPTAVRKKPDEDVLPVCRLSIFPLLKLISVTVKENIVCREQ